MKKYAKFTLAMVLSTALFTGCTTSTVNVKEKVEDNKTTVEETVQNNDNDKENNENIDDKQNENSSDTSESSDNKENEQEEVKIKEIDLQEVKPNETGQIMVVMYHALGDEEKTYIRTRENFKEDLRLLYEKGYRPISLRDYINNEIDIEAGKTPVVFTFDDGNNTDFNIIEENGEKKVDPNSAMGILEDFNKQYPDFGLEATFFLFGNAPFRQKDLIDYKLKYIVDKGMDIGNHTSGHENLGKLSINDIQKTMAQNVEYLKQYLPDYEVNILALPYGARPKSEEKRKYLFKGSFDGVEYNNIGALAVGWKPEYASIHKKFDYKYIHRVHGSSEEFGIRYWLDYFDKNPSKRYVSDGDKDTITVLESQKDVVDESKLGEKELRTYTIEEKSE
ncbi:polysaccharide deacetylase family protein [Wukongibacter baidiensis]|uniref:polysaccharide deacetylase family protein n=1 Tax=Wukongibacter baidiensis TaxID=1723361 RepID=UPI003D7F878C